MLVRLHAAGRTVQLTSPAHYPQFVLLSPGNHGRDHVIAVIFSFCDLVELWEANIKKPVILCARI